MAAVRAARPSLNSAPSSSYAYACAAAAPAQQQRRQRSAVRMQATRALAGPRLALPALKQQARGPLRGQLTGAPRVGLDGRQRIGCVAHQRQGLRYPLVDVVRVPCQDLPATASLRTVYVCDLQK